MIQHDRQKKNMKPSIDDTIDIDFDEKDCPACGTTIYDTVRGVSGVRFRKVSVKNPLQVEDDVQAQAVWDETLLSKMILRGGGHVYFAIETAEVKD